MAWDVSADALLAPASGERAAQLYMGRAPDKSLEGKIDLAPLSGKFPREQSSDGCPGGWYRTAFASSVLRYRRRRAEGGGRVENGLLRDADELVWLAVLELEREEERAHAHASEAGRQIAERARKKASKGKGRRRGHRG